MLAIKILFGVNLMNWYVLFVQTGKEYKVEKFLTKCLDSNVFSPFVPMHEKLYKISGTIRKEVKPLFPGYVFIESEIPDQDFIKYIRNMIFASSDIISMLKYSNTEIAMRASEMFMLISLSNADHCIKSSSGVIEGDRINIIDGPLKGWESKVRKINRHKRQVWIEIEFMGDIRLVCVALEVVKKY